MHPRHLRPLRYGPLGLAAVLALAGCAGAATTAPSAATPTAMTEHSTAPTAAATTAAPSVVAPVSQGKFHDVDGAATGSVLLFHNADGSFTITLEDFSIASAAGIQVVLVTNKDVTGDGQVDKATLVDLGPLKGTSGMQDFTVPGSADAMTFHTVVLWDPLMAHAVAAAPLG